MLVYNIILLYKICNIKKYNWFRVKYTSIYYALKEHIVKIADCLDRYHYIFMFCE